MAELPNSSENAIQVLYNVKTAVDKLQSLGYQFEHSSYSDQVSKLVDDSRPRYQGPHPTTSTVEEDMGPLEEIAVETVLVNEEPRIIINRLDNNGWRNAIGQTPDKWRDTLKEKVGPHPTFDFIGENGQKASYGISIENPDHHGLTLSNTYVESQNKLSDEKDKILSGFDNLGGSQLDWLELFFGESSNDSNPRYVLEADLSDTENDRQVRKRMESAQYIIDFLS